MVITGKTLPRRTLLRGIGAAVALPFLDAMRPAVRTAAAVPAPRRFVAVYVGNGMNMSQWTPALEGPLSLSPTLQPLSAHRDRLVVLSGLDNREGGSSDNGGLHSRIQPAWLTGAHAKRTEGADVEAGVSIDQVAARILGRETQLPSLELALESVTLSRACEPAFACTYVSTLSWKNATTPLPAEVDPRAVFERLFGDRATPGTRAIEQSRDRSILDGVTTELARLRTQLGPGDRATVASYLDTIRDVERHIEVAERQNRALPDVDVSNFTGIPASFSTHAALMFDLMALAFQADLTRVATCLMVRERSDRAFPESGVDEGIHPLSHHEGDPARLRAQASMNTYHVRVFGNLLDRLRTIPDGDGTLLDSTAVLFGSGMSDSNTHSPRAVPTLLAGCHDLGISGGRHVAYPSGTPLANLGVTLLNALDVSVERVGDSTGPLRL